MATLGESNSNIVYLSVVNGYLAQRVKKDVEKAVERTLKSGKVIYERLYNHTSGIITKIELRSNEFDGKTFKSMNVTLDDEVQVQFNGGLDNPQNKDIINTLLSPGCNIAEKLTFIANKDEDGYSRVFILQDGKGIKRFSNKANPNGVPQPVQKEKQGEKVWDWTDQDEWYFNEFKKLAKKIEQNEPNKELDGSAANQQQSNSSEESKDNSSADGLDDFPDRKGPIEKKKDKKEDEDEDINNDDIPF